MRSFGRFHNIVDELLLRTGMGGVDQKWGNVRDAQDLAARDTQPMARYHDLVHDQPSLLLFIDAFDAYQILEVTISGQIYCLRREYLRVL